MIIGGWNESSPASGLPRRGLAPGQKKKDALWGAYNYTPDRDVARAAMTLTKLPFSADQLTWAFTDVTDAGGKLTIMWDTVAASVPFTVAKS